MGQAEPAVSLGRRSSFTPSQTHGLLRSQRRRACLHRPSRARRGLWLRSRGRTRRRSPSPSSRSAPASSRALPSLLCAAHARPTAAGSRSAASCCISRRRASEAYAGPPRLARPEPGSHRQCQLGRASFSSSASSRSPVRLLACPAYDRFAHVRPAAVERPASRCRLDGSELVLYSAVSAYRSSSGHGGASFDGCNAGAGAGFAGDAGTSSSLRFLRPDLPLTCLFIGPAEGSAIAARVTSSDWVACGISGFAGLSPFFFCPMSTTSIAIFAFSGSRSSFTRSISSNPL